MKSVATCPSQQDLQQLAQGSFPLAQVEQLALHLEQCETCAQTLAGLPVDDTLVEVLRQQAARHNQPLDPALASLTQRLRDLRPNSGSTSETIAPETNVVLKADPPSVQKAEQATEQYDFLSPPEQPDEIGRLGPYRVLKVLGKGGMGMVFKAEDPHLSRMCALKTMLPAMASRPEMKKRFLLEARAAAQLEHDNIIPIYQVAEDRGVPYIAMPFLKGASLEDYLKQKQKDPQNPLLSVPQILKLAREIARGLAAAHDKGMIHRDIKPANIWLDGSAGGRVKILDFGLARLTQTAGEQNLTQSGAIMGTPSYMAPEQARAEQLDGRADLFSLGVILYRLCTGELPFKGSDPISTLMALATHDPAPPASLNPTIPAALSDLVMRLLAKDAASRTSSAAQVLKELQQVAGNLQTAEPPASAVSSASLTASPSSPSLAAATIAAEEKADSRAATLARDSIAGGVRLRPPFHRRPSGIAAMAGGLLAIVAGIVFYLQTRNGTIKVEIDDPQIEVTLKGTELKFTQADSQPITIKPSEAGQERVFIVRRGDDFEFSTDKLVLKKGDKVTLKVALLNGMVRVTANNVMIGEGALGATEDVASSSVVKDYALDFDGKSNWVRIPTLFSDGTKPLTLECWMDPRQLNGDRPALRMVGQNPIGIHIGQTHIVSNCSQNGAAFGVRFATSPRSTGPYHAAVVWDGQELRLYIDGKRCGESYDTKAKPHSQHMTLLGGAPAHLNIFSEVKDYFDGTLDEIRFSRVARYTDDFTPEKRFKPDADTMALYHCDDGDGDILTDASGNEHHGKIHGAKFVKVGSNSVDLLALVDPYRDAVAGSWRFDAAHRLQRGAAKAPDESRLQIPYLPPEEYDLNLSIEKDAAESSAFCIGAVGGGRPFLIVLNWEGFNGLQSLDGLPARNNSAMTEVPVFVGSKPTEIEVRVRRGGLTVLANGRQALHWDQGFDRLQMEPHWLNPNPRALSVGMFQGKSDYRIREMRLTPLSGPGELLYPSPSAIKTDVRGEPSPAEPALAIAPFDAAQAKAHQEAWANYLGVPVEYTNSVGMKFRLIPPGEFNMGSTPEEVDAALKAAGQTLSWFRDSILSESPRHKVVLTRPFYLGICEVTQAQYEQLVAKHVSAFSATGEEKVVVGNLDTRDFPVETVSWNDAVEFCVKLSQREQLNPYYTPSGETSTLRTGAGYRLPSEAEWEFACRAGTTTRFCSGNGDDDLAQVGWYGNTAGGRTHNVGTLRPNQFGIYDMHSNVWEWVQDSWQNDFFDIFSEKAAVDPANTTLGDLRVVRGGDWGGAATGSRSAHRHADSKGRRCKFYGFRVSLPVDAVKAAIAAGPSLPPPPLTGSSSEAPPPAIAPFHADPAEAHQEAWANHLGVPVEFTNSIGMRFRLIPPGEFMMGSTPEEIEDAVKFTRGDPHWQRCIRSEAPLHKVILSQPIYLSVFEVTQGQFQQVLSRNPSHFCANGPGKEAVAGMDAAKHPVESVSWHDAAEFCANLSQQEKLATFYSRSDSYWTMSPGTGYRLPTEAEWEFACRAGATTRVWNGDTDDGLPSVAWFKANSSERTHAVGELAANPFGLCDMHGNVWEWVQDSWDPAYYAHFQETPAIDPVGPTFLGPKHMARGGGWTTLASGCRSADRYARDPVTFSHYLGFRVALSVDAVRDVFNANENSHRTKWQGWPAGAPKTAIAPFDNAQAKAHQEAWAKYLGTSVETTNSVGAKMILIPPGECLTGSSDEQIAAALKAGEELNVDDVTKNRIKYTEQPQRKAVISKPFLMTATEVTVAQFRRFVEASKYVTEAEQYGFGDSESKDANDGIADSRRPVTWQTPHTTGTEEELPVRQVSWNDAVAYCQWLSAQEGQRYRLPSTAEWEYACRGGQSTQYYFGDDPSELPKYGWHHPGSGRQVHLVGQLLPNPFGLFDMHGNLHEWCQDVFVQKEYPEPTTRDPNDYPNKERRAIRGGSYYGNALDCRIASVAGSSPSKRFGSGGFRYVREFATPEQSAGNLPTQAPAGVPKSAIAPFNAAQAKAHQEAWAKHLGVPVEYTNSLGMKYVLIPPGQFTMGSTPEEMAKALTAAGADMFWHDRIKSEAPRRRQDVSQAFYLGIHEVTQRQFETVAGQNPSYFSASGGGSAAVSGKDTGNLPVDSVTWNEAFNFCVQLNKREGLLKGTQASQVPAGYRLPLEVEWEFACGAGTATRFWPGDEERELASAAWFHANLADGSRPVGGLAANPFGLFDMHGNVTEWCQDVWVPPNGGDVNSLERSRVLRGGGFHNISAYCRTSARDGRLMKNRRNHIGFRTALTVDAVRAALVAQQGSHRVEPSAWTGWPEGSPPPAIAPFDADQAKAHQEAWAKHLGVPVEITNSIGMKFMLIPPGEFTMGSTAEEMADAMQAVKPAADVNNSDHWRVCIDSEGPMHKVVLTKPFYLATREATQAQYKQLMEATPSHFSASGQGQAAIAGTDTATFPVEQVSWNDAAEFCARLSQLEGLHPRYSRTGDTVTIQAGTGYRLPTEAEWEFACRAGTTARHWTGDRVEDLALAGWFGANAQGRTHAVGELKANPLGLFDMHGNVWEWVEDTFQPDYYQQFAGQPAIDPPGSQTDGTQRIARGGGWLYVAACCRSSNREAFTSTFRYNDLGFRVALSVEEARQAMGGQPSAGQTSLADPVEEGQPAPPEGQGVETNPTGPADDLDDDDDDDDDDDN
ncbi:MAG: SUMF1/EgtB/PvdO family nonheme iron enzyme [Pirellulales bacterium]